MILSMLAVSAHLVVAQNTLTPRPEANEVNRYTVLALDATDVTLKLDSMTGVTWRLCTTNDKKTGAAGPKWCAMAAKATLPAGPIGRYSMVTDAALRKQPSVFLVDSISGRSWLLCTSPVSDKQQAWCSLDE